MKGFTMTKAAIVAATAFAAAAPAFAQSSVTLYGIVDDSIVYQSSQTNLAKTNPGRSNSISSPHPADHPKATGKEPGRSASSIGRRTKHARPIPMRRRIRR